MENKRQVGLGGGASSSNVFDHLFGPKDSSSSSSSSSILGSIFPPPPTVVGRDSQKQGMKNHFGYGDLNAPGNLSSKGESSGGIPNKGTDSTYQNETTEPCYFSSSIYYGGQENYSPRTSRTTESPTHIFKKDSDGDDDPNGNSASRGNWWQGSLYY